MFRGFWGSTPMRSAPVQSDAADVHARTERPLGRRIKMESTVERAGVRASRASVLAVAALIGAMIADFTETAIDPANTSDGAKFFAAAAHHHDRMVVSAMLLLASALLLVPGVFGVAGMLRA